jgi:Tol biopolymer transport system component
MTPSRWQQIEELYQAALECEPSKRAAILAKADPELRREVESLLAQESGATPLDHPAWEGAVSLLGSTVAVLTPGTQLGPYKIEGPLGAGGMGEVFRGVDTRLGRPVAVKTSREQFSARFDREARAISSLNHPNICTLYDVGPNYLVMELCEGETLAERLKRGKLSIQETLRYGAQIADALAAAHAKGITHRDLKPGNIMLGKAGIKVLDFGLAKSPQDLTLTGTRMVMGTPAYMAPEQREGKECNARTDIYALGLILYEMATGKRAEQGQIPSLDTLPPQLAHVIERCLAAEPEDRWQSARDLQRELQWAATSTPLLAGAQEPGYARRPWLAWTVAAVFLLAFAGLFFVHFRETTTTAPNLRLTIPLPGNTPAGFLALSPDGRRLVIHLTTEGAPRLWLRSLDSPQLQLLPGTENARAPFWSPDGRSIGFFADAKLKTIPVSGGPPQVLCDGAGDYGGGTWNRAGVILFSTFNVGEPLQRVNAPGGACTAATKLEGGHSHAIPEFLPDGKHFIYVVRGGDEATRGLYVASLDTALDNSASRRLLADESSAVFAPSTTGKKYGYLLFLRGSELMAQPFSAETLQLAGDVFPIAAEASNSLNPTLIAASASPGGILAYEASLTGTGLQLAWLDRSGKELAKVGGIQGQYHVALSPDGKIAATVRRDRQIWLYDLQRGGEARFTSPPLTGSAPVWSPEGNLIAFGSGHSGSALYLKDASGGSKEELLLGNGNSKEPSDWSRDGRYLIYTEMDSKGQGDIWYLLDPLNKSRKPKPVKFQGTEAKESQGQLSPDGRWLAYASDDTGKQEIYVRPFPSGPGRWKVSAGRGPSREPRWRHDGKELYFLEAAFPNQWMMAVPVQSGPPGDFRAGVAQALFEFRAIGTITAANLFLYSPSPDGQRFLVNVETREAPPTLNVVTNWEKIALGIK